MVAIREREREREMSMERTGEGTRYWQIQKVVFKLFTHLVDST